MLFHEIYGSYFQVVAAILREAADGALTASRLTAIVQQKAFAESTLAIPAALDAGVWPLLDAKRRSVLHHPPTMPLTTLHRRWLKALLLDPRIRLFAPDTAGLEDVAPLYKPDTFVFFDRYTDGDPYNDPHYIQCFRTILQAIHENRQLRVRFHGRTGTRFALDCVPYRLEYSAKDDKFRLLAAGKNRLNTINLARIHSCEMLERCDARPAALPASRTKELTLLLHDERNGLARVLLHFSHFEKETLKLDENHYQLKLRYDKDDETELLIRVLAFGPVLEVKAPAEFVQLIKSRIRRQMEYR